MIDCIRSFCLVKSRVAAPRAALDLVSMMLQCVTVNCIDISAITGPSMQAVWLLH